MAILLLYRNYINTPEVCIKKLILLESLHISELLGDFQHTSPRLWEDHPTPEPLSAEFIMCAFMFKFILPICTKTGFQIGLQFIFKPYIKTVFKAVILKLFSIGTNILKKFHFSGYSSYSYKATMEMEQQCPSQVAYGLTLDAFYLICPVSFTVALGHGPTVWESLS